MCSTIVGDHKKVAENLTNRSINGHGRIVSDMIRTVGIAALKTPLCIRWQHPAMQNGILEN